MTQNRSLFVISHTHWDREWYRPFQQFRLQLVELMDRLLDLLANSPAYRCFLLDGQTILVEDYLALRPERAEDLRRLVMNDRLQIGPWYVQPDEFLVSGEALIRNLLLGKLGGAPFGGVTKVGWLPDAFGHIAQLPQILRNFGIESFLFSRGLGDQPVPESGVFWWEAPSGHKVLAIHQKQGYWCAGNLGYRSFWGDARRESSDLTLALHQVNALLGALDPGESQPVLAVWNGADHTPPQDNLPDLLAYVDEQLPALSVRHGTVPEYAAALLATAPRLPTLLGELRDARYQCILSGTHSSRIHLKQANHRVQRMLERWAEPLAAIAMIGGAPYPAVQLREAWRLLLQNHTHDGICGCSLDPVHEEMTSRFNQAEQIASEIARKALAHVGRQADTSWCPPGSLPVLVFNSLGICRSEVVTIELRLPYPAEGFRTLDEQGCHGPTQMLEGKAVRYEALPSRLVASSFATQVGMWWAWMRESDGLEVLGFDWRQGASGITLSLQLGEAVLAVDDTFGELLRVAAAWPADQIVEISAHYHQVVLACRVDAPACGYAVYAVELDNCAPEGSRTVTASGRSLLNDHLRLNIDLDGTLQLLDRAHNRRYLGLNQFEDCADAGDTYDFSPLLDCGDPILLAGNPALEMLAEGPLLTRLRIQQSFRVPESLRPNRKGRARKQVHLPVVSTLTLTAGSPWVEIETAVDNRARDHRLRVRFPTGMRGESSWADGQFSIIARPIAQAPAVGWAQNPPDTRHHITWFGIDDGSAGLAVLGGGLPEHAIVEEASGQALALTLLRSVGSLSRSDLTAREGAGPSYAAPGAQCLGDHVYRYGLLPYSAREDKTRLAQLAAAFDTPLLMHFSAIHEGVLPSRWSLVNLHNPNLLVSATKREEGGERLLLRLFNPQDTPVSCRIRFGWPLRAAWKANMAEEVLSLLDHEPADKTWTVCAGPGEVVTILLELDGPREKRGE